MKTYCVKDHLTGHVFKVLFSEKELHDFLEKYPDIKECVDCIECEDAPSLYIE
jgi:hypothetical protein